jgi:hypothetical protein
LLGTKPTPTKIKQAMKLFSTMGTNNKTRLGAILIEFLIIVVGVLVALAANSAMDQYRQRQSELEAPGALRRDITEDLNQLDRFWTPRLDDQVNARMRPETFRSSSTPIVDSDQFVRDVGLVSIYATFAPNTAAIEDLINRGRLGLIDNKQLRYALLAYFNEIENIAEFDVIHRAYFLDLSGRLGPKIVVGGRVI